MTAIIQMDATQVITALGNVSENLTKELRIISSKTAKKSKSLIAKQVTTELAVKQKIVRGLITTKKVGKTGAEVEFRKSRRIRLRDFGARQTRKGVSYRISKTGGRKVIHGAFQGPAPGRMNIRWKGRVKKRVGKSRMPIQELFGPSPWGVFKKKNMNPPTKKQIDAELLKQSRERLRYKALKKIGAI